MDKKLVKLLNKQISIELYSSHLYLQMKAAASRMGLNNTCDFFTAQAEEERHHADLIIEHLLDRGEHPIIDAIDKPKNDFESVGELFKDALAHEELITNTFNSLSKLAHEKGDYVTVTWISKFIEEQLEEMKLFQTLVDTLNLLSETGTSPFFFDKEVGIIRDKIEKEAQL